MIRRELPIGTFPDVVWWDGAWWVASHEADRLVLRSLASSGNVTWTSDVALGTTEGLAFPRLWADTGGLWIAWRASANPERAMISRYDGAWSHRELTGAIGNHPVAVGHGWVAWQDAASGHILRQPVAGGVIDDAGLVCAVGLSRILPDGTVRTMDEDHHAQAGVTRPAWAGAYVVGECPVNGLYLADLVALTGCVWAEDRLCKTPRVAVSATGQIAVVTWGDRQAALVTLLEPAELTAEGAILHDPDQGAKDVIPYYLGNPSSYPHATSEMTWDVVTNPSQKLITAVLGGDPAATQVCRYDDYYLYLHWDDWKQAAPGDKKEHWGYTYLDGRWLRRLMAVGESIVCDRNRIRWIDRRTGVTTEEHGLPYTVTLVARYLAYPCGALGFRPAIEWHYAIGDRYRERNLSVQGWGLYQWTAQGLVNGAWVDMTDGPPIDRQAPASVRVTPNPPPMPTTVFPVVLEPPVVEVLGTYPRTLTGAGYEPIIEWVDRANPPAGGLVWLEDGSVRVAHRNAVGTDTTGIRRPVIVGGQ